MAVSKILIDSYGIDLTTDTVANANDIAIGKVGHLNDGTIVTGTFNPTVYAFILATYPAGSVCTCTNGSITLTATDTSGSFLFNIPSTGTWTVSCTNGSQTASNTITITYQGESTQTILSYFSATISATYPSGSTCTCSDGSTTLTATDTSGSYTFTVPNAGSWTVSCTDGTQSKSQSISITTQGQSESVALSYALYLYNKGNQCASLTGGWQIRGWKWDSGCSSVAPSVTFNSSNIYYAMVKTNYATGILEVANNINFTDYTMLTINISNLSKSGMDGASGVAEQSVSRSGFVITNRGQQYPQSHILLRTFYSFSNGDIFIDISNISGSYDLGFLYMGASSVSCSFNINEVYMT